jgi:beta-glucosidase-like glycosyl hydrolase
VTDDLNMSATSDLPGGVGSAAVRALAAGADIALIAYDPEQAYPALLALMDAVRTGRLDATPLARSKVRLDQAFSMR